MASIGFTRDLFFTTTTVVDWVDVFTRPNYKRIVIDSLKYSQDNKRLVLHAWVLMTNHLHMIVSTNEQNLSDVLRDFKKFTSKKMISAIMQNENESRKDWLLDRFHFAAANDKKITYYKFWQDGNYVEEIQTADFCKQKINYIHQNPVRQEFVTRPEDYLYSSARNYSGMTGLLEIEPIVIIS